MKLSFHGAAGGVTGSCHLLQVAGKKILIDCGMFQGEGELYEDNAQPFGFHADMIDVLLLTHAHLDHCGRIPLLVKQGFKGEIICTSATRDLARLVLLDSARLHEEDAKRRKSHGHADAEPLYDTMDALDSFDRFGRTAQFGHPIQLGGGVIATFTDAGHILGAASILLECDADGLRKRVLFSGDIGPSGRALMTDTVPPSDVDVVVLESTYGDRDHRSLDASVAEFHQAIRDTLMRGGNVLIPAFALERTQELLFYLRAGIDTGVLPRSLDVYLDSPMAISATQIFKRHPEAMRPEIAEMLRRHDDPLDLPNLHFTREAAESREINEVRSGAVIVAGSGMCTGGRIRHHLRHNLAHSDCSVIFVGFAAEGTLAREIIDGAQSVRLFGHDVPVKARIHTINGFSAHAGRSELVEWHRRTGKPEITFLVHGEQDARQSLSRALENTRVELPQMHSFHDI